MLKKSTVKKIIIVLGSASLAIGIGAVSFAAWGSDGTSAAATATGSTGAIETFGFISVEHNLTNNKVLVPFNYTGDSESAVKIWEIEVGLDGYMLPGYDYGMTINYGNACAEELYGAMYFYSGDAPFESPQYMDENWTRIDGPFDPVSVSPDENNKIYIALDPNSTQQMNKNIQIELKINYELDRINAGLFDKSYEDGLLTDYPDQKKIAEMRERTVDIELPNRVIGDVLAVKADGKNILAENGVNGNTITLKPEYKSYALGKQDVTVITDKATYSLPLGLYTMIISDADELDAFRYYTTYQREFKTATDGTERPTIYDGAFALDSDIVYNDYSSAELGVIKTFASRNGHLWDESLGVDNALANLRKYPSFITSTDRNRFTWGERSVNDIDRETANARSGGTENVHYDWNFGFVGLFDGLGHKIDGLFVQGNWTKDGSDADLVCDYGGFIGKLLKSSTDSSVGSIRNIAFTNIIHGGYELFGGGNVGCAGGFLYRSNISGNVQNIYIQAIVTRYYGLLGMNEDRYATQLVTDDAVMRNVLLDIDICANIIDGRYAFSQALLFGSSPTMVNLYTVAKSTSGANGKMLGNIKLGETGGSSVTVYEDSFADVDSFKTYLGGNPTGWDEEFWDVSSGVPLFKVK